MKKPIVEFKFIDANRDASMMVSLEDILFIDEYALHLKDDGHSFLLTDGEYERLKNYLMEERQ